MKRLLLFGFFFFFTLPAWAGKTITIAQLNELLHSLAQDKKSDLDVATALKQVELSEQLTRTAMNSLVSLVNGPMSTEQIYVLEARSANLAPPPSDLPDTAAPDSAAQKAILARAEAYVAHTYEQLPALTATKTTLRFQDNMEALAPSSGMSNGAKQAVTSFGFTKTTDSIHYINSTAAVVVSERGAEKKPSEKDSTRWGANGMTAIREPAPSLVRILHEAQSAESIQWLRWELINRKPAAVFSFTVPRQKSKLALDICCFPNINQTGVATFYTATTAAALGGGGGGGGGATGNFQTHTEWHDFKTTAPYHGRLFIDPETGVVLRMITEAELKPSDMVHQLDTRVDFGPVKAGPSTMIVPVRSVINSVVVPNGEAQAGGYKTRCTLFTSDYSEYRTGATK